MALNLFSYFSALSCTCKIVVCIILSIVYVGSLYIWPNSHARNHPSTIKKRFLSVFVMSFVSAYVVYLFVDRSFYGANYDFWSVIGLRCSGALQAIILPLLLTMVLFMGPMSLHYNDGIYNKIFDLKLWLYCSTNAMWLRNHVIAPFFEEFTFRACIVPILVPCFGHKDAILYCPLFFGIAHLHLLHEKLTNGVKLEVALLGSFFQLAYTTVFGAYSTYLFLRTGHVLAPFVAHAFCNHMGFPDFEQLLELKQPKKTAIVSCFVAGLLLWMLLLKPLTQPHLFNNVTFLHTLVH